MSVVYPAYLGLYFRRSTTTGTILSVLRAELNGCDKHIQKAAKAGGIKYYPKIGLRSAPRGAELRWGTSQWMEDTGAAGKISGGDKALEVVG